MGHPKEYIFRKLIWCPVFKAASSTWMQQIPNLTNFKATEIRNIKRKIRQQNELIKILIPPLSIFKLQTFLQDDKPLKFLIVRHPFDRLLSAYRDKFEQRNEYFHGNYGKMIVKKYRENGIKKFGADFYDKDGLYNGCPLGDLECRQIRKTGSTPTFWEFIQAILRDGISNGHWNPITLICRFDN